MAPPDGEAEATANSSIPILDACLTYIVSLMKTRDKRFVADATVRSFDFSHIKAAREILFRYADPKEKYAFRGLGQQKPTHERSHHALDSLFNKLCELDKEGKLPIVACPSHQLHLLPSMDSAIDPRRIEDRFQNVESNVEWLKAQLDSLKFMQSISGIPPKTRGRLDSTASNSAKRLRSEENEGDDDDDYHSVAESSSSVMDVEERPFIQPKYNVRKAAKRVNQSTTDGPKPSTSFAQVASKVPVLNEQSKQRKPPTWGKCTESSELLGGAPPDIFLSHCRRSIEEENVKSYLEGRDIVVTQVKKTSHNDAQWNSFRVSIKKYADFNKILSGDIIPNDIAVRQYYKARINRSDQPRFVNHPRIRDSASGQTSISANNTSAVSTDSVPVITHPISSILDEIPETIR